MDSFVDVKEIDPVSVNLEDDTVFLGGKKGSVCMDLPLSDDDEKIVPSLLVRNMLYTTEKDMGVFWYIKPDNVGISTGQVGNVY